MSFLKLKKVVLLAILLPGILLTGCSPQNTTGPSGLIWTLTVSKVEVKANLNSVEKVTQYNGSESDVPHQQTPDAGNVYLIINLGVQKEIGRAHV